MKKPNCRSSESGQGLAVVIVLILLLGGGAWWLYSHKQAMDKEGRAFGHEMINRVVLNYEQAFLGSHLSPQAKLDLPMSDQNALMNQLRLLGQPAQPFQVDENMTWESNFFEPKGFFTAHLNFPAGPGTLQIAIDHPVSKWQVVNLSFAGPSMAR
jgi:hypothetical protein